MPTTPRQLEFQDYHGPDEETGHEDGEPQTNADVEEVIVDADEDEDAEEEEETTTTTTTRSTRPAFVFPTRNRNIIPSRRPSQVNI